MVLIRGSSVDSAHDIEMTTDDGAIATRYRLKADKAADVTTEDGAITVGTSVKDGTVNAGTTAALTTSPWANHVTAVP